jgi:hypothetical protein
MSQDDFDLLPADTILSPDDALQKALGLTIDDDVVEEEPIVSFGRGWSFDFIEKQFVQRGRTPAEATGLAQLAVWVEKCLRTPRNAFSIYSPEFGVDHLHEFVGHPITPEMVGKMARDIEDALLVHDRISNVKDFEFEVAEEGEVLLVSFTVVTDEADVPFDSLAIGVGG